MEDRPGSEKASAAPGHWGAPEREIRVREAEASAPQSVEGPPLPESRGGPGDASACTWPVGLPGGTARYPGCRQCLSQSFVFPVSELLLSKICVCVLSQTRLFSTQSRAWWCFQHPQDRGGGDLRAWGGGGRRSHSTSSPTVTQSRRGALPSDPPLSLAGWAPILALPLGDCTDVCSGTGWGCWALWL